MNASHLLLAFLLGAPGCHTAPHNIAKDQQRSDEALKVKDGVGVVPALVWGTYDVSARVPNATQAAEYRARPIPFRYALLPADCIHSQNLDRILRARLKVKDDYSGASVSLDEATEAAVCALHIFRITPVLSEVDLAPYVCQMVGVSLSDHRQIVLNFLCHHDGEDWDRQLEYWHDGGACFVQMLYDLREGRMSHLKMNGYF
jgi:hypothetical protein